MRKNIVLFKMATQVSFLILPRFIIPPAFSFVHSINPSDVNECDDNPNYCQVGGQCVNTPGSYRCLCKQGYEVGNGGSLCIGKTLVPASSISFRLFGLFY